MRAVRSLVLVPLVLAAASCASMKYGMLEKVGVHKRDIMSDEIKGAVNAQTAAKETIQSTYELFAQVVKVEAGQLEKTYNRLNAAYLKSEGRAQAVRDKIAGIESVSKALFKEWKAELGQYESQELRRSSEAQLKASQAQYDTMIKAMKTSAAKMDPVLRTFHDHVLFMKHNLNSAAISSIRGEVAGVQSSVESLIKDMDAAIAGAQSFLATLGTN
jgi:hypothetical protein